MDVKLARESGSRDQESMLFLSERGSKDPYAGKWLPNKLTNKRTNKPQMPSYAVSLDSLSNSRMLWPIHLP